MIQRSLTVMRGLLKRHGPSGTKKLLWDEEFSNGHWNFIDDTMGDCVYPYLEKYSKNGSILDLGCGPGNTANELAAGAYQTYVGMDISDSALEKARKRSEESGRTDKNRFEQGDFLSYTPTQQFDVILFRESMYHVPEGKVEGMLKRYSPCLTSNGVFIVRMNIFDSKTGKTKRRLHSIMSLIETHFELVENCQHGNPGPTVLVFRPRPNHRTT